MLYEVITCMVWQFIVFAKSLTFIFRSDSSRDVEFFSNYIFPYIVNGINVFFIACECCNISHARVHISRPDSMANCFVLLDYRFVVLPVRSVFPLILAVIV